ncbi:FAD-binding domain-containing protein [Gigaspora margarita]|uniref:FAD-binding domain-containing protein n=1 Tax=Gigaspora margarita TaxID=4874 RepID=A0A8H3X9L2_GIGMA|nr:FAD-binding domain-containing protein [Gigaspora margarita]
MISYLYNIFLFIVTIYASQFPISVSKCPGEDSLRYCLDQYKFKGPVNFRDDFSAYNKDIDFEYNRLTIYFPIAFVHPLDEFDVQIAIQCGTELNIPTVARSGGHSYEGYSLGGEDCSLVISLKYFNNITIDAISQTAVIGTGIQLKPLYYKVHKYGFAFPAGLCPLVGVGGHMLGGGMGFLSRKFGMAADNILDAKIVLANGTVVYSAKKYPELFWAIRGGGNAGYGIVTSLTLRIHPIPKIVTRLIIDYDFDQIPLLFSVLDRLGPNFHQNLTVYIVINSDLGPSPSTSIDCIYLGSADELRQQVDVQEFIKLSKPKNVTYIENSLYYFQVVKKIVPNGYYKPSSFFFDQRGIPDEGLKYFMQFIKSFKCKVHSKTLLIAGGKVNEIRRNEISYVHRGFKYHIFLAVPLPDAHSEETKECIQDLENFRHAFQNYASYECYQNLIDRQLDNWQCRYYAESFERLVEIKRKYDPYNLFRWNQSIPTTTNISC